MPSRALLSWSTALLSVLLLTACTEEEKKPYAWQLPPGFPEPFVPADNPMSEEKVAAGPLPLLRRAPVRQRHHVLRELPRAAAGLQ